MIIVKVKILNILGLLFVTVMLSGQAIVSPTYGPKEVLEGDDDVLSKKLEIKESTPEEQFVFVFKQDFEHHNTPIEYTTDIWNPDWNYPGWRDSDNRWPGWWSGKFQDSIIIDPQTKSKVMKFSFKDTIVQDYAGQLSYRGGDYWKTQVGSEPKELYISYNIKFRPGWIWNQGGKLPAFNGGTDLNKATQDNCTRPGYGEGFSTAVMWQSYGGLGFYMFYQEQDIDQWGDTEYWKGFQPEGDGLTYDSEGRFIFDVTEERWYNVTIRAVVNSFKADGQPNKDGIFEGFINGHLIEQITDLYLLTAPDINMGVNEIALGHFFGGNQNYQAPKRDEWSYLDDFILFYYADGVDVVRGNTPSPPDRILDLPNFKGEDIIEIDKDPPTVPSELKASKITGTSISLEWKPSQDATEVKGYRIFLNGEEYGTSVSNSYSVDGLDPQTSYTFSISAYDVFDFESAPSAQFIANTIELDLEPPTIPTNLTGTDSTSFSISISWSGSTDNTGVEGYRVYLNGNAIGTTVSNSFSIIDLKTTTQYFIQVSAFDASNNESGITDPLTVYTRDLDLEPPSIPQNLTPSLISSSSITMEWSASSDNVGVAGYNIRVNGEIRGSSETNNYIISNLYPGLEYSVTVSAFDNSLNESDYSVEIKVKTKNPDNIVGASLPEVEIIEVNNSSNLPNILTTVSRVSSLGYTELYQYGLTISQSKGTSANDFIVFGSQDFSKVLNINRVKSGLQAYYLFDNGYGSTVSDHSESGNGVDLIIKNPSKTVWLPGQGLNVNGETLITSASNPTGLINSLKATNEITLEAWVRPAKINQTGPARIMSISKDSVTRAATLGQAGNEAYYNFVARLNTSSTTANGDPTVSGSNDFINLNLHHIVYTRNKSGEENIYLNGEPSYSGTRTGNFSTMTDDYRLSISNESSGGRHWEGTFYLLAVYNKALSKAEVDQNLAAGIGEIEFTNNLLVEPNVEYLAVPFARTNQGTVVGKIAPLKLENELFIGVADTIIMTPYPNPSDGNFLLEIGCFGRNSQPATIRISDMMGQILYTDDIILTGDCNASGDDDSDEPDFVQELVKNNYDQVYLPLSTFLHAGIYSVILISEGKAVASRVVVM